MPELTGPLAMVSLIVAPSGDPETMAVQRAWVIPAYAAEDFAAVMTKRFGAPLETMATNSQLAEAAERNAAAGQVFHDPDGGSDD